MLDHYSFVDYFTIPPSFVSIYLDRTWIGEPAQKMDSDNDFTHSELGLETRAHVACTGWGIRSDYCVGLT